LPGYACWPESSVRRCNHRPEVSPVWGVPDTCPSLATHSYVDCLEEERMSQSRKKRVVNPFPFPAERKNMMDLFAIRTTHQAKEQTLPQRPGYQERLTRSFVETSRSLVMVFGIILKWFGPRTSWGLAPGSYPSLGSPHH
jgi:hypothetical protein